MTTATDNGLAAAVQALTEGLRTACASPADAIRLLSQLAAWQPDAIALPTVNAQAAAALDAALGQLGRRAALASLAQACADWQPSSYDEAAMMGRAVGALFDAEITVAGDGGQDATYAAVLADLSTRGGQLAHLVTVAPPAPLPSLAIAYRLYRDASRSDDLIARVDPPHPGFMPLSFEALAQ
jgi:prophage DNA circulation protein